MVKIDLGAHVDGYIVVAAHTVIVKAIPVGGNDQFSHCLTRSLSPSLPVCLSLSLPTFLSLSLDLTLSVALSLPFSLSTINLSVCPFLFLSRSLSLSLTYTGYLCLSLPLSLLDRCCCSGGRIRIRCQSKCTCRRLGCRRGSHTLYNSEFYLIIHNHMFDYLSLFSPVFLTFSVSLLLLSTSPSISLTSSSLCLSFCFSLPSSLSLSLRLPPV